MIKAIVLDFDGVLVKDSEILKRNVWQEVFPELGEKIFEIIDPLIEKYSGGKGTRFDIIREVCQQYISVDKSLEDMVHFYALKYNDLVQKGIVDLGINLEDKDALYELSKKYKIFLNSATPDSAIKETLKLLDIDSVFHKVLGHNGKATSKIDNLRYVVQSEQISSTEICFLGDSNGDRKAALGIGCIFFGVAQPYNKWSVDNKGVFSSIATFAYYLNHS